MIHLVIRDDEGLIEEVIVVGLMSNVVKIVSHNPPEVRLISPSREAVAYYYGDKAQQIINQLEEKFEDINGK